MYISSQHCYNPQPATTSQFINKTAEHFGFFFLYDHPTLVDNVTAIPGISDHDSIAQIEFTTKAKINKKKPHKIYTFHQADFKQIQEEMRKFSEQYFNEDPDKNTIHENWNRLKSKIHDLREKFVPSKMSSTRHNLPYITRAIKRMINKKQRQ